jgi:hypothetical protein
MRDLRTRPAFARRPKSQQNKSEPGGIRTRDPLIKSQMLYRLSYGLAKGGT